MYPPRAFTYLVYLFLFTATGAIASDPIGSKEVKASIEGVTAALNSTITSLTQNNAPEKIKTIESQLQRVTMDLVYSKEAANIVIAKPEQAAVCETLDNYIKTGTAFMQAVAKLNNPTMTATERVDIPRALESYQWTNIDLILGILGYDVENDEEVTPDPSANFPLLTECDPKVKDEAKKFYASTYKAIHAIA